MQPFEIHLALQRWLNCDDARPWLIVRVLANGDCECFPISGACYGGASCFQLSTADPDFPATGLSKDCFVHDSRIYLLRPGQFLKLRGALTGTLLAEGRDFLGAAGEEQAGKPPSETALGASETPLADPERERSPRVSDAKRFASPTRWARYCSSEMVFRNARVRGAERTH